MARSILLLGSNLGDREEILEKVKKEILSKAGQIVKSSSVYETEPWGFVAESRFLNQVIIIDTKLKPGQLLTVILEIEEGFGRRRDNEKFESRILDIDILFYDDRIINEKDLIIPHPRIQERMFVLKPLVEISEDLIHPVLKKSIKCLFDNCIDKLKVEVFKDQLTNNTLQNQ